jgi:hypothetical protein
MSRKRTHDQLQDDANRLALVMLGVLVLGQSLITRHDRQNFTVHELAGGLYHVCEVDGKLRCTTCKETLADQDRHAALVLLYVLALEGGRP